MHFASGLFAGKANRTVNAVLFVFFLMFCIYCLLRTNDVSSFLLVGLEKNFTEIMELLHVPLQTVYDTHSAPHRNNHIAIENGHSEKV